MLKNKVAWLFLLCCAIPLISAYILVKINWSPTHTTNTGQFLSKTTHIEGWQQSTNTLWSIGINAPVNCGLKCTEQIARINKLYVALGKKQKYVELVLFGSIDETEEYAKYPVNQALNPASVYLIDHRGLVVLEYPYVENLENSRIVHKGLMKDLKKLLNYARSS